ncbi:hypothetical protein BDA99DRAFT_594354 [Phascolomyces articulosus]|uniref:Uncharacterized protein n=1 Tax=Phascolomyces articulosus TaxID=60185 RepID=A0AAD5P8R6_9FUNG|nr:hypothetical protein BDA99DRAFT_594354 [Phascolomyces articulosus]
MTILPSNLFLLPIDYHAFVALQVACRRCAFSRTMIVAQRVQWGWFTVSPMSPSLLVSLVAPALLKVHLACEELTNLHYSEQCYYDIKKRPCQYPVCDGTVVLSRLSGFGRSLTQSYSAETSSEKERVLYDKFPSLEYRAPMVIPGNLPGITHSISMALREDEVAWLVETGGAVPRPKVLAHTPTVRDSQVDLLCEQFAAIHLGASTQASAYVQHQYEPLNSLSVVADNIVTVDMGDSTTVTASNKDMDVDVLSFDKSPFEVCLLELATLQQWLTSVVRLSSSELLPEDEDTPMTYCDKVMEPTLGEPTGNNSSLSVMAEESSTQVSGSGDSTSALVQTAVEQQWLPSKSSLPEEDTPMAYCDEVPEPFMGESSDNNSPSSAVVEASSSGSVGLGDSDATVVQSEEEPVVVGSAAAAVLRNDVYEVRSSVDTHYETLTVENTVGKDTPTAFSSNESDASFDAFVALVDEALEEESPVTGTEGDASVRLDNADEEVLVGAELGVNAHVGADELAAAVGDAFMQILKNNNGTPNLVANDTPAFPSPPPQDPIVDDVLAEILGSDESQDDPWFEEYIRCGALQLCVCGNLVDARPIPFGFLLVSAVTGGYGKHGCDVLRSFLPGGWHIACTCVCCASVFCWLVMRQCHNVAVFVCVHVFGSSGLPGSTCTLVDGVSLDSKGVYRWNTGRSWICNDRFLRLNDNKAHSIHMLFYEHFY